ncbi:hypothetical protein [Salinispora vitiensis]|nr:hypothetical protein [Salinispora vitiensis]
MGPERGQRRTWGQVAAMRAVGAGTQHGARRDLHRADGERL